MNFRTIYRQIILITLCAILTLPVSASETICDNQDPKRCSTPLKAGEVAPYSGQLLTPKLALDLGLKARSFEERLAVELKFQKKTLVFDLELERKKRKVDLDAWSTEKNLLLKRLKEAHHRTWYEHPIVVAAGTATLTVLLFWGARESLKEF